MNFATQLTIIRSCRLVRVSCDDSRHSGSIDQLGPLQNSVSWGSGTTNVMHMYHVVLEQQITIQQHFFLEAIATLIAIQRFAKTPTL